MYDVLGSDLDVENYLELDRSSLLEAEAYEEYAEYNVSEDLQELQMEIIWLRGLGWGKY